MNYLIYDIKTYYRTLDAKRKVQLGIIAFLTICLFISTVWVSVVTARKITQDTGIEYLKEQNLRLARNNEMLISTVNDLNKSVIDKNLHDSIRYELIKQNNSLIPVINNRLATINKKYNENISLISAFTPGEISSYIANEARRLRSTGDTLQ